MKVPRPNLGVDVQQPNYSAVMKITVVDHVKKMFFCSAPGPPAHSCGEFSFDEYSPAYTWNNFAQALREWDYHWQMSDDPRLLREGEEMRSALVDFYRKLVGKDTDQITQKIVEIVVMSTQPK